MDYVFQFTVEIRFQKDGKVWDSFVSFDLAIQISLLGAFDCIFVILENVKVSNSIIDNHIANFTKEKYL